MTASDGSARPPRRPTFLSGAAFDAISGGYDPAAEAEAAHTTAAAIVDAGRGAGDPELTARLVGLVDDQGLEHAGRPLGRPTGPLAAGRPVAAVRAARGRAPRPGRQCPGLRRGPGGRRRSPHVVAGVADPTGPQQVSALADAVLTGVFQGDLAVALERAGAFCRVSSTGRAHRAAELEPTDEAGSGRADPQRGRPARHRRGPRGRRPALARRRADLTRRARRRPPGAHPGGRSGRDGPAVRPGSARAAPFACIRGHGSHRTWREHGEAARRFVTLVLPHGALRAPGRGSPGFQIRRSERPCAVRRSRPGARSRLCTTQTGSAAMARHDERWTSAPVESSTAPWSWPSPSLGAFLGALLAPSAHARVGPLTVRVDVRPSLHPGTQVAARAVRLGPVRHPRRAGRGQDQHRDGRRRPGPGGARARARACATWSRQAPDRLRAAVIRAGLFTAGFALLGALLLGGLGAAQRARRRWRPGRSPWS